MKVSLTGQDTINLGGVVLSDFADEDVGVLEFPDQLMNLKIGKNGNAIYAFNASGVRAKLTIRLLRGSDDDKYCNGLIQDLKADPAAFVLLNGQFVKRVGDGQGNVANDTYVTSGGVPTRIPGATSNTSGSTDQSVVVYEFEFGNSDRGIL